MISHALGMIMRFSAFLTLFPSIFKKYNANMLWNFTQTFLKIMSIELRELVSASCLVKIVTVWVVHSFLIFLKCTFIQLMRFCRLVSNWYMPETKYDVLNSMKTSFMQNYSWLCHFPKYGHAKYGLKVFLGPISMLT